MHPNEKLLHDFYGAFAERRPEAMAAAYAPEARFTDPVFPELKGERIGAMWRMLCIRGKDLELEVSGIEANDTEGRAHWEARYTFSATKRKVHNVIDARFEFADGKIVRHIDNFSFYRWSRMALGVPGILLGWSGPLRRKVGQKADAELTKFIAREAEE